MTHTIFHLGVLIALGILGWLLGPTVLLAAGLPGSLIDRKVFLAKVPYWRWRFAYGAIIIARAFVVLAWVSLIITYVRNGSSGQAGWSWLLWIAGWPAAIAITFRDAKTFRAYSGLDNEDNVARRIAETTNMISGVGYWSFALTPGLVSLLYGWLPYIK
jgi:hypothetical protein